MLFLIIFSASFVSASEDLTHGDTDGKMTLSADSVAIEDRLSNVNLDSIDESTDSTLGIVDDVQNTNEIENKSRLTFNDKAPILGVSKDEPVLGTDQHLNEGDATAARVMKAIQDCSDSNGGTVYLYGRNYTGTATLKADQNKIIYIKNVKVVGGSPENPNQMATFDPGHDGTALSFEGYNEPIPGVYIPIETDWGEFNLQKAGYYNTSGVSLTNVVFENIKNTQRMFSFSSGSLTNCVFNNFETAEHLFFLVGSYWDNTPIPVTNVNFTNCHQTYPGDHGVDDGDGQLGAIFGAKLVGCNFINTSSANHGGAFCLSDESEWGAQHVASSLIDCNFINITSRWFAVYIHGNFSTSVYYIDQPQVLDNCKFINCSATSEYGGAVGISHNSVIIKNSDFINNTGGQGSAIMVGGIDPFHDGFFGRNTQGNDIIIDNCYFENNVAKIKGQNSSFCPAVYKKVTADGKDKGKLHFDLINGVYVQNENGAYYMKHDNETFYPTGNAGAIFVFGNDTQILNSIFKENVADSGEGAAIYIFGDRTKIENSEFYNHKSDRGTVYIEGNDTYIVDSTFKDNTAINGAGVYIEGDNTTISSTEFDTNTATTDGGAIYIEGNFTKITENKFNRNTVDNQGGAVYIRGSGSNLTRNNFTRNEAVPQDTTSSGTTGLGGAFYVYGNNTVTLSNNFTQNKARNGSAIYTTGNNFKLTDDWFNENQAWSYTLLVEPDPEESWYNTSDVKVTVVHVGGDNIINSIHNTASNDQITLSNVIYKHINGNLEKTGINQHPVTVYECENATKAYQYDREYLQEIAVEVKDPDGITIKEKAKLITDIYGEVSVLLPKSKLLKVGKYTVNASHDGDWNYKEIKNIGYFRILGYVDLSVTKTSDKDEYFIGDTVTWTITVTNANNATAATYVNLTDVLPSAFTYVSCDPDGEYDSQSNNWTIGTIEPGDTKTLTITTTANSVGTFVNVAQVYSYEEDWNPANNKDNKTVKVVNLGVEKTVNNNTPYVGDTIVYTLNITNDGVNDYVRHLKVVDVLPDGLIFANQGEVSIADLINKTVEVGGKIATWYISNIPAKSYAFITVKVNVTDDGSLTNTVTIDGGSSDNETVTAVPSADLSITKTVSPKTTHNDTIVTWTITVKNNGPSKATNVKVNDALPKGLVSFVVKSKDCGSFVNGVWNVGDMENGAVRVLVLESRVNATNTTITNIVNVTSDTRDPHPENNSAENKTVVPPEADLEVNKTVSASSVHNGTVVFWTITVKNNGPDNATNVRVTDALPKGLVSFEIDTIPEGTTFENGVWSIGDMNNGTVLVLVLKSVVNATNTTIVNNVSVTNDIYDPNPDNNNGTNKTVVPPEADLSIVKTVDCEITHNDTVVTWTIVVTNNGPDDALNVTVCDAIPDGLVYIPENSDYSAVFNGTHVVWEIPKVVVGTPVSLTLKTRVNATNRTITNVVNVTSDIYDPFMDNNTAENKTAIPPEADLSIVKTVDCEITHNDTVVTWTIVVTNNGPDDALNVTVCDAIPDGLVYIPENSDYSAVFNGTHVVWEIPKVVVGTPVSLTLKTRVNASNTTITNVVNVKSDTYDPHPENNSAENKTVVPPEADLEVNKTVSASKVSNGNVVFWTITVKNNGPDNATNVRVTDALPKGLVSFEIDTIPEGTTFENGVWSIGDMNNGTVLVLVLKSVVNATNTTIVNNVSVTNDIYDPNPDNNNGTNKTVVSPEADLSVTKVADVTEAHVGDVVSWTITVTNLGPDAAVNVTVSDVIPSELTYNGVRVSKGKFNEYVWSIGDMDVGEVVTLVINTTVAKSNVNITNVVTVTSDSYDPNMTNNEDNDTVGVPPEADLSVTKVADVAEAHVGDVVSWTITVTNLGPDAAVNVKVTDIVPELVKFDVVSVEDGSFANNVWSIDRLESGDSLILIIKNTVDASNVNITNVVVVTSDTYDPNETNNEDNDTVEVPPEADLSVTKVADVAEAHVGDVVSWTIAITNLGPDAAVNVRVTDVVPVELVDVSVVSVDGSFANNVWTIGDMDVDEVVTLVINTTVAKSNVNVTNVVVVTSDTYDPNETNNEDNDTVEVPPEADLSVTKVADVAEAHVGDVVSWTIAITNLGPDAAVNVRVTDVVPVELVDVSVVSVDGSFANNVWSIDRIESGDSLVLVIETTVAKSNVNITNVAVVTSETYDPNETNNEDNDTVEIPPEADLEIAKVADVTEAHVGDVVSWTIAITNLGPDAAVNVRVTDVVPVELVDVSVVSVDGSFANNVWSIDRIESGDSLVLVIETTVAKSNVNITNVAVVTSETYDPNETNNEDNDTVEIPPEADLEIAKVADVTEAHVGDVVSWTIAITNLGPDAAVNVRVTDVVPVELVDVSVVSVDGSFANNVWSIDRIESGDSLVLVIETTVAKSNVNVTNVVTVNSKTYDPNETNNKDNDTVEIPPETDLAVTITNNFEESGETCHNGDIIVWTIVVTNNGPDDAINSVLEDVLPDGVIYVTHDNANGTYDNESAVWSIGDLPVGETVTLTITTIANTTDATVYRNVSVSTDTYEPDLSNNYDDSSVNIVAEADLEIIKSVSDKAAYKGDIITWIIIVKNNGADTAVNVVVTDKLPSGVVYDSDDSNGAYNSVTGIWNVGNLAGGESTSLRIYTKVVVTNEDIINFASVTSDTYDPNKQNNQGNDSTTVLPVSDLEIIDVPDVGNVAVGDEVEYEITVVNQGPDAAVNTYTKIIIPDSLRFLGVKPSEGTYDPETGIWTIGDLEPGEKAVLKLDAKVLKPGSISIKTSVESDTHDANITYKVNTVKITPKEPNHRNGTDVPKGNSSDVPSGKVYSPEKMPATGNPIVMMLLALLAIVGLSLKRKS